MQKTRKTEITLIILSAFFLLAGWSARAQEDFPRSEIFAGYTYASFDPTVRGADRQNAHGWAFSVNGNVNRFFGLTADIAGHYGDFRTSLTPSIAPDKVDFRVYEYLFGPTLSARTNRVTGFAHFLVGPTRVRFNFPSTLLGPAGVSETKFSMGVGGGVDFNVNRNLSVRAVELDYLPVRLGRGETLLPGDSTWSQNFRLKTGLVFKF